MGENIENQEISEIKRGNVQDRIRDLFINYVGVIPVLGPALSSLFSEYIPERRQNRLYEFLDDFLTELKDLKEDNAAKIDMNYLYSEEFGYIFEETLQLVTKAYQKEKIKAFKNILINSLIDKEVNQDIKEIYLHLVDELTDFDIFILKKIHEGYEVGIIEGFTIERTRHDDKSEMRTAMFELFKNVYKKEKSNDWKMDVYSVILHLVSKKLLSENDLIYEHYRKMDDEQIKKDDNIVNGSFLYNVSEYETALSNGFVDFITSYEA